MVISPFESAVFSPLLSDSRVAAMFSDAATVRAMLETEGGLACACGKAGLIPPRVASSISAACRTFSPEFATLGAMAKKNGPPVAALNKALQEAVGKNAAQYVHFGATSQDIMDTAMILQIRRALVLIEHDLEIVSRTLADLATKHLATPMCARTRFQHATPTTFGLKTAKWLAPLVRQRNRLSQIRPRLLVAQLGGAAGSLDFFGDKSEKIATLFAEELRLATPILPWHEQRDSIGEFAGWLSLTAVTLGKIGGDLSLMAQTEIGEVTFSDSGESTAMPQKSNSVTAETLVSLARYVTGLSSRVLESGLHAHERSGDAWQLEWLTLPQMIVATAASLRTTREMLNSLHLNTTRMQENLEMSQGLILAEAATRELAHHIPLNEAREIITAACAEVKATGRHLSKILSNKQATMMDWSAFFCDWKSHTESSLQLASRSLRILSKANLDENKRK